MLPPVRDLLAFRAMTRYLSCPERKQGTEGRKNVQMEGGELGGWSLDEISKGVGMGRRRLWWGRHQGKTGTGTGHPSPAACQGRAAPATGKALQPIETFLQSQRQFASCCSGQSSRVKGWFSSSICWPRVSRGPSGMHTGTILELDKTSWVLNSGRVRNILEFDMVCFKRKQNDFLFCNKSFPKPP